MNLSISLSLGSTRAGPQGPTIVISASSIAENAVVGSTVGVLSVVNGTGTWTFTKTADPDAKFVLAGTGGSNLNTAAALNADPETGGSPSHSVTIQATNGTETISRTFSIGVTNVFEQPTLSALSVPASVSRGTTISITGATTGSAITGTMPTGWTLNGAARTIAIAADAPTGSQSWSLTETLADSANSPRVSSGSSTVSSEPTITIAAPTWSDDFNAYADGTRLVAGDPNANAGLVATNPGNLGWDALRTGTANNARFNPIVFQGQVRSRTTGGFGDWTGPGSYVLAPAGLSQSGDQYAQMTASPLTNGIVPSFAFQAADQNDSFRVRINGSAAGAGAIALERVTAGVISNSVNVSPFSTKPRMGGANGQFSVAGASETLTALVVNGRGYLRRGPGFPLGDPAGVVVSLPGGARFGLPTQSDRPDWVNSARVGSAPLFITVDETHRFWVPKKRASASDPITAGVGDETFTGTYVGTIPSRMQWALFNMATGAVIKDWALVPTADFTASGGTWSARLRSIPAGLNGRGAYAVGFRPVNASDQTDPAWACVSNKEFYVTLNVGLIGQSNSAFLGNAVTGTAYPRVDGLMSYGKADPPSLVRGDYTPNPNFWTDTTTGVGNGRCTHVFGEYLANLYNLPVSFETLAISAQGAVNLGPNGVNWSYIQTHHAFAGSAYDVLYLSQGENEFTGGASDWLTNWVNTSLPAYRDPAFHGQPAGTVIPLFYTITGRFSGTPSGHTDANAQTLRVAQYQLESSVSDCYLTHSYTGVEMVDSFHYVTTNGEGYNEVARRIRLTYDKVFNGGAYDGRGPIATSVERVGGNLEVSFDLNGATSLVARDGRDQTLAGNASALTGWQISTDNFSTTLPITSVEIIPGNKVRITPATPLTGPTRTRNHFGLNPDISSWASGSYADGTFIGMMPLVNSLLSN